MKKCGHVEDGDHPPELEEEEEELSIFTEDEEICRVEKIPPSPRFSLPRLDAENKL